MNPKPDHGRHVRSWAASFAALRTATCVPECERVRRGSFHLTPDLPPTVSKVNYQAYDSAISKSTLS